MWLLVKIGSVLRRKCRGSRPANRGSRWKNINRWKGNRDDWLAPAAITIVPMRFNLDPFGEECGSEFWRALELAHLKHFATTLPGRLEYNISEGGDNISMGQRQLLCLARALLKQTRILVMDGATAAVDVHTDSLFQSTIREKFANSTVFTITHRLNIKLDYDRAVILDHDKIVEFDSPSVLLEEENSSFARMDADVGEKTTIF